MRETTLQTPRSVNKEGAGGAQDARAGSLPRTCRPVEREAHTGAGLLAGLVTPWGIHAGAACS